MTFFKHFFFYNGQPIYTLFIPKYRYESKSINCLRVHLRAGIYEYFINNLNGTRNVMAKSKKYLFIFTFMNECLFNVATTGCVRCTSAPPKRGFISYYVLLDPTLCDEVFTSTVNTVDMVRIRVCKKYRIRVMYIYVLDSLMELARQPRNV